MSWKERLFATGKARAGRPHPAEADTDASLEGVLGFITAVYGVALTPSDPSVLNRLAGRRSAVIEGATLEQLVRSAGVATAETCRMLIDHLPFAVVIADATGLVLLANDPALHALRLGEIIASRDGRIHVADPVASDRLHAAIERACAPRESDPQPVLISVTPEAPWRQVVVMRITRGLDARYAALLFPDSRRLNGAARILASLFSFTAAEARMAVLVLEGRTLAQAASALGVRTRTALETWKNVRLKLRTRTDSDCLRVLGAALLITESGRPS